VSIPLFRCGRPCGALAAVFALALLLAACGGSTKKENTPITGQATPGPGVATNIRPSATAAPEGGFGRPAASPTPSAVPGPKPSNNSSETLKTYLDRWQKGDYAGMYALLTQGAQSAITLDRFTARYQGINDEATVTGLTIAFTPASNAAADTLPFSVTYKTSLFGDVPQALSATLVKAQDGWRIAWTPSLIFAQLGATNLIHTYRDDPQRGAILAKDGSALAVTAQVAQVGTSRAILANPAAVPDKNAAIQQMAQALGLSTDEITKKVSDTSQPADYFIVLKTLPFSTPQSQIDSIAAIRGVVIQDVAQRVYPLGAAAAHVTGYVSNVTADELKTLAAQGYTSDDIVGQSGLEANYEKQLAGTRGARLTVVTPDGGVVQTLATRPGTPPMEIVTTIDPKAQQGVVTALGTRSGSMVMLDPTDNSVLALASYPNFDPNWFVQGLSDAQAKQVFDATAQPLLNRATEGQYPPGSTFKVITTTAGMLHDNLTTKSTLPCPPVWYGLGKNQPKANWRPDDLGNITLTDALMTSCDPVFYQVGLELDKIDPNVLPSVTATFGYGKPTGINGLDEAAGLDPNPDWKQKVVGQPWFTGDTVNMAIGQGYLLTTPLQVANAYSAIVRNGDLRTPLLVKELRPATAGAQPQTMTSQPLDQIPFTPDIVNVIKNGMRAVVQDPRGTAYDVFKGSKLNAAGKSGTAEDVNLDHVSFVAFAPFDAPKAVCVTVLDKGVSGSLEAGPIVRQALEAYLFGG
jgi:penicillin-binding protein 2